MLSATMSNEELKKIRSLDKAKKLILKQNLKEEQEDLPGNILKRLLTILQTVMGPVNGKVLT